MLSIHRSDESEPEPKPEDCATAWFAALERARNIGDRQLERTAIQNLRRLGVQVFFGEGSPNE